MMELGDAVTQRLLANTFAMQPRRPWDLTRQKWPLCDEEESCTSREADVPSEIDASDAWRTRCTSTSKYAHGSATVFVKRCGGDESLGLFKGGIRHEEWRIVFGPSDRNRRASCSRLVISMERDRTCATTSAVFLQLIGKNVVPACRCCFVS